MMPTLARLLVTWIDGPFAEGTEVNESELRYFSSQERAEEWLRGHLDNPFERDALKDVRVLSYSLLLGDIDAPWQPIYATYDSRGNLVDTYDWRAELIPFYGRRSEDCAFAVGEAVLCIRGDRITRGVIYSRPPEPDGRLKGDFTDDTYLVDFPGPNNDHAHLSENAMWKIDATGP